MTHFVKPYLIIFVQKKNAGRSHKHSLGVHVVFVGFGQCLCCFNFERDIVDTLCHASRKSATTGPNKSDFLLQEGKTQRPGNTWTTIQVVPALVGLVNFCLGVKWGQWGGKIFGFWGFL